jgi:RNA recognition motif-containing protein
MLRGLFSAYGGVEEARVVRRRETGDSRGFGYVTFLSDLAAFKAKQALDGSMIEGSTLRVDLAR